jgi:hypothetical protein
MSRGTRGPALLVAALVAVLAAPAPATSEPSSPGTKARLREVAALYGDRGATTARVVGTRRIGAAGRVLGEALPGPPRPLLVFVLAGRTPPGPETPTPGSRDRPLRDAVVSGAIDARGGAVIAVRRSRRAPDLAPLGPGRTLLLGRAPVAGLPPHVVGATTFDTALTQLLAAGYRVAVSRFPSLRSVPPATPNFRDYLVSDALPVGRRVVRLQLDVVLSLLASPVIPERPPGGVTVPSVVGLPYATALAVLATTPGLYVRIGRIGALRPAASVRGLDAFVVSVQQPAAGSVVPAFGVSIPHGVDLGPSVVTFTLGVRGPGAETGRVAQDESPPQQRAS